MAKTVTIALREAIIGHQGAIEKLVLRAPTLPEYMTIGEPVTVVPNPDGKTVSVIENDAAIAAYSEVCITEPADKLLLKQVALADAMDVKDAILDFFGEARRARTLPNSPTP